MLFDCTSEDLDEAAIIADAGTYLQRTMADEADPGLCVADAASVPHSVTAFGHRATEDVLEKSEAYDVASVVDVFLEEYGGTGDGVIGALGAVGLTAEGGTGRFIAYDGIREYGETVGVERLHADGIRVVDTDGTSVDTGTVNTHDWIRPQLRGGEAVLPVTRDGRSFRPANLE